MDERCLWIVESTVLFKNRQCDKLGRHSVVDVKIVYDAVVDCIEIIGRLPRYTEMNEPI